MLKRINEISSAIDKFLDEHTTVKSVWRMALLVTLAAVAKHFGFDGFINDVLNSGGDATGV